MRATVVGLILALVLVLTPPVAAAEPGLVAWPDLDFASLLFDFWGLILSNLDDSGMKTGADLKEKDRAPNGTVDSEQQLVGEEPSAEMGPGLEPGG